MADKLDLAKMLLEIRQDEDKEVTRDARERLTQVQIREIFAEHRAREKSARGR